MSTLPNIADAWPQPDSSDTASLRAKGCPLDAENVMTLNNGAPLDDDDHSWATSEGYLALDNTRLLEKNASFNRERIPDRTVHARGSGAHGYFEVTKDVSAFTKADFLNGVGKRTPAFVRFSTVRGRSESSESNRDVRGFSIKHYTQQGVYDMVGNNTPIFFVRDPMKFVDVNHVLKSHPRKNVPCFDSLWDFATLTPESLHQFMYLFGPRGIPASYRHMNGYSSNTYKWVNAQGEGHYVKYHYKPEAGNKWLTQEEADSKHDMNMHQRDLFDTIEEGGKPAWTMYVQLIPEADVAKYKWNIFDVTKVVPHGDYPLVEVGKLVLTRNPDNYFAEVEQVAFSPSNFVPGIEASPDRILQARLWAYHDAQRYRLGKNFPHLPINAAINNINNFDQDGRANATRNGGPNGLPGGAPGYYPNSHPVGPQNGVPNGKYAQKPQKIDGGFLARHAYTHPNDDFEQPRALWRHVFSEEDRQELVKNFAGTLITCRKEVQERFLQWVAKADDDMSKRVQLQLAKTTMKDAPLH